MTMQAIWDFLAQLIVVSGSAAAIVAGLFKWLGAKWIDDRLSRGLEELRLEHAKELAQTKIRWDADLQGRLKYQEREFAAVGEAWHLLQRASSAACLASSPFAFPFDVPYMDNEELRQFLNANFSAEQVRSILAADDQTAASKQTFALKIRADAEVRLSEMYAYINSNFPFIPSEIFDQLTKASDVMQMMLNTLRLQVAIPSQSSAVQRYAWNLPATSCAL
jgi:hypothetical protein